MKKRAIVIGGIALLAVVGIGGTILFGSRIRAALSMAKSATMKQEEITAKAEENARTEEEIRRRFDISDLTPDADLSSALQDGSMTLEEAAALLLGEAPAAPVESGDQQQPAGSETELSGGAETAGNRTAPEAPQEQVPPSETTPAPQETTPPLETTPAPQETTPPSETTPAPQETTPPPETTQEAAPQISEEEQRLKNLMAQMVLLRGTFTAKIETVIQDCIAEFLALPPEEQTTASKMRIGYSKLDEVADMELDCDTQVAGIVAQIREIDSDLADQVQKQYQNEKELKKASLIAQYT